MVEADGGSCDIASYGKHNGGFYHVKALQDKAAQLERNMEDVCLDLERERALLEGVCVLDAMPRERAELLVHDGNLPLDVVALLAQAHDVAHMELASNLVEQQQHWGPSDRKSVV